MTTLLPALVPVQHFLVQQQSDFESVLTDYKINFSKEVQFALQVLSGNDYLAGIAQKNQESFRNAIINVAAIGISLNPASKLAYLVPRKGTVCLDISYQGLQHIAVESGSVLWIQSKIVHANDTYESQGIDKAPMHQYSAFGSRGDIVGAYCVAKVHDGSFLTEEMSIEDIHKIRARSESFKKGSSSPWSTDYTEMVRKTVIKRASKSWPKSERMGRAIHMLDSQGEGIDFESERRAGEKGPRAVNDATDAQIAEINQGLDLLGRPVAAFLQWFGSSVAKRHIERVEDMSEHDAGQAIAKINQLLDAQAAKQESQGGVF